MLHSTIVVWTHISTLQEKHDPSEGPINQDPTTYHANRVLSYKMKVQKLIFSRRDHHGWNESRFLDKHGGLLGKRETINL